MRYALTIDADGLRSWQLDCVETLRHTGVADLRVIFELSSSACAPRVASGARSQRRVPIPAEIADAAQVVRIASPALHDAALHALHDADVDFILDLSSSDTRPDFASVPRYGIWSFHHGDPARRTSGAHYFWDVLHDRDVGCAMLVKRGETGETRGSVLRRGYFATDRTSYETTVDRCFFNSSSWPADVCGDLARGIATYFDREPLIEPLAADRVPNAYHWLRLRAATAVRRASASLRRFYYPYWNVGLIPKRPAHLSTGANGLRLLRPHVRGEYLGDPYVFERDGKTFVFCEQFLYANNHGRIVVFELRADGGSQPVTAIDEPFHMSYPQVFESDGALYCLPETSAANEVRIYQAANFPAKWELRARILCGFPAVDPTLLRHDSRWWIFCTRYGEHQASHLYIWHSPSLFGPWEQHPRNPVKIDARSVRGAGPCFEDGGVLYRPAQDCSRRYGGRLAINRIVRLSQTEFEEVVDRFVDPPAHTAYSEGMHTLAAYGESSVVDVKRDVFSWNAVTNFVKHAARRNIRRLGITDAQIERLKVQLRHQR